MENKNNTALKIMQGVTIVIQVVILVVVLAAGGAPVADNAQATPELPDDIQTMAEGDTNFTNVVASGDVTVGDDLTVGDDTTMAGDLTVSGTTSFQCTTATITNNLTLTGTLTANIGVFTTTLDASGATTLNSTLDVDGNISSGTGAITMTDAVNITSTLDVDSTLNVDGASTLVGAVTASGDLTVDDTLNLDDTASTITGTQTITPTTTFYTFAPATVLTLTLSTGSASAGDLLILANIVATTTTVVDTTCTIGGSVITLGDGDNATFMFYDSKWCTISTANNS